MANTDFRIDTLGTSFSLTVDEDPLYLDGLLSCYKNYVDKAQKEANITDPLKSAIVAGLMLCDDLEKLRVRERSGERVRESADAESLVKKLIEKIDSTVPLFAN